ncbi:MAG: tRNA (adenosine(37)-N6)-threonylcarbamoyltransferase complex dimerization subunit type 1 TsaB [Propionicimonas sp.]|uniref:tRNA (adenosine(37)-N6)-threonylcarbamoyltransferase complex dimerization subunit type 1 TsaB n=1 Tax=Propionicimonas sp. TaxID=1955623 RepID=UPI002B220466|nr:tRNA (adenosine(37)-N6)-threonylcarbamoyltransferase complex dimerization subunit type 1 TsaB [Propionicimonas sp.]MEA4943250.1 tRNA (adenosine(37)-N6)-threonylcarbamoyltransferase complex dimerization subunit type 1 TsaB [Propionicimonas sp.]MEA5119271.1 tRNA (adenosine(37)-N6)-threonylcarbamoyltransferase complex dimerization subunit type 1 TsaB [Propionicimonas sp.]
MSGLVLGIDTSSVVCAGLAADGEVVGSLVVPDTRAHAEQLTPLIRRLLDESGAGLPDLASIAVGVGPGPFTGLRVGVVAATVLAEVLQLPIKGVCSLDVLALQAVAAGLVQRGGSGSAGDFVVASDARRKEWYWATYHADGSRDAGPFVTAPDGLPALPQVGPVTATPLELDAGRLAALAAVLPDAGLEPLYLRRPDAEVPTARKSTLLPPRLARRPR